MRLDALVRPFWRIVDRRVLSDVDGIYHRSFALLRAFYAVALVFLLTEARSRLDRVLAASDVDPLWPVLWVRWEPWQGAVFGLAIGAAALAAFHPRTWAFRWRPSWALPVPRPLVQRSRRPARRLSPARRRVLPGAPAPSGENGRASRALGACGAGLGRRPERARDRLSGGAPEGVGARGGLCARRSDPVRSRAGAADHSDPALRPTPPSPAGRVAPRPARRGRRGSRRRHPDGVELGPRRVPAPPRAGLVCAAGDLPRDDPLVMGIFFEPAVAVLLVLAVFSPFSAGRWLAPVPLRD